MSAILMEKLCALGVTPEQLDIAQRMMTELHDGADYIQALIDGCASSNRSEQTGHFIEVVCKHFLDRPSRQRRGAVETVSGPQRRWGYCGPITPRLPEKEWWPLRGSILRRDGNACHYCGDSNESMCADHVIPLSRGGTNDPENLVACCLPCNSSKSDRLLSEWRGRYR